MTQKNEHESTDERNDLSQNLTTKILGTSGEVENMNDRIKAETTPETCRASLDGN
ncbi:hypothetical protein GQF01_05790 [Paenibacillus sp. 5J-6]|uniref:DUF4025 domain-containing protein n=1 Tax=Paenibacillus silvestris TaxID=2606219 RepID=A0A6L8UTY8_9BACL|nr:hypothetical protein [Paenibacillus silvestris]MZQ81643.1 hypothetical protein [Paenibacillus silvestris]